VHPILFHIGKILIPSYGALAAVGVLAALSLAQRTARMADVDSAQTWNVCVVGLLAVLAGERLLLIVANWNVLQRHPGWTLGLAMVHHPLVSAAGAAAGLGAAAAYARWRRMPLGSTADALAPPLALGLAFEQIGALLAGAGYGIEAASRLPWAVTYTSLFAARWSGTPLGIPLHPVQVYAAIGFLTLTVFLLIWLPARRRQGDIAGLGLIGLGVVIFLTETWRDPEGRGMILHGALDVPQIAATLMVVVGALILRERRTPERAVPSPRGEAGDTVHHQRAGRGRG
jgi:phosphatidylglycerol:prolipoprotein diacylglycerol transferase